MNLPSNPQDHEAKGIQPDEQDLYLETSKGQVSEEMVYLDAFLVCQRTYADLQAMKEVEETKRKEIEEFYRSRMQAYSEALDKIASIVKEQSENQKQYVDKVFSFMNRMLDEGYPELSVLLYETFVNDEKRKNLIESFLDSYEAVSLGKINIQRK